MMTGQISGRKKKGELVKEKPEKNEIENRLKKKKKKGKRKQDKNY